MTLPAERPPRDYEQATAYYFAALVAEYNAATCADGGIVRARTGGVVADRLIALVSDLCDAGFAYHYDYDLEPAYDLAVAIRALADKQDARPWAEKNDAIECAILSWASSLGHKWATGNAPPPQITIG